MGEEDQGRTARAEKLEEAGRGSFAKKNNTFDPVNSRLAGTPIPNRTTGPYSCISDLRVAAIPSWAA
jgi:hypothetical protein